MKNILRAMLGVALFLASLMAGAVPPDKVPIQEDYVGGYIHDCGAFNILFDYSATGHIIFHFDKNGDLVRQNIHANYLNGRLYNSADTSIEVPTGPGEVANTKFDLVGDPPTVAVAGAGWKVTVPGLGLVVFDIGRRVYDLETGELIFLAGPTTIDYAEFAFEEEVLNTLCELLTP